MPSVNYPNAKAWVVTFPCMTNADLEFRTTQAAEEDVLLQQAKRDGVGFVASARSSVTSGGTLNLHLKNPANSGIDINVESAFTRSQFEGSVDIHDAFSSAPSGGVGNGVDNLKLDSGNDTGDTQITVNKGVSYTASNTHVKDVLPSGGAGGQIGGEATGTEPLIEPDREIVVEVTNDSGTQAKAAISVVYVEETRE